jgi:D-3-phosphoglycerate dehydrogenase
MASRKWKILVTAPYFQRVLNRYADRMDALGLELHVPEVNERLQESELLAIISEFDGVISGDDQFTERVLAKAKNLKVISKWGTGIDSIDLDAATRLNVAVRNTPNAFSEPVGDTVFAFILAFSRGVHRQDADVRGGIWVKQSCFCLQGSTLGIVGVGNCGKAVARRAGGFGMRLLGNDVVHIDPDFRNQTRMIPVSLEDLLAESDFVSMNCDLNPTSYHLMCHRRFQQIKKGAYYISTCRGAVTDEQALAQALLSGRLAGAALDVFEQEPLPPGSPLRRLDNVLLTPHNANSDPATADRIHEATLYNLMEELEKRE